MHVLYLRLDEDMATWEVDVLEALATCTYMGVAPRDPTLHNSDQASICGHGFVWIQCMLCVLQNHKEKKK